ncbi:MAG: MaoC family dehydratase N-terminal domain-containing protein [Balneolaceae bacterium]
MLDRSRIGYKFVPFQVEVEKGRLRLFAKAVGETNPLYTDEDVALQHGYPSLPAPLTYSFCLGKDIPDPADTLHLFDLDFSEIVHGEQEFEFFEVICAGDVLHGQKQVVDIYERKGGALEFIVVRTDFSDPDGRPVCRTTQTIIVTGKTAER